MSGIGIITNPHSKLNKRNPGRTALLGYILGSQGQLEVTNSLADLGRVARDFKDKNITTLAINGGDGTICRTLTAFAQEYGSTPLPKVALLRGGTINVLANNLGIKGTPEQILYRLVEWHSGGMPLPSRRLRSLRVEGNIGFLFGNGAAAAFLKEYYRRKSGPLGAFIWVIWVWLSRFFGGGLYYRVIQDLEHRLVADQGYPLEHTSCAVFCSTLVKMPLGFPLFHQMKTLTDTFQTVSFTIPAKDAMVQLPLTLAASLTRQDRSSKGKMSFCCRDLLIECQKVSDLGGRIAGFDYTLDGELYVSAEQPLHIGMGPEFEFVTI